MRNFLVTDAVRDYAVSHGSWEPDAVLRDLHDETVAPGSPAGMQIGADEGQLFARNGRRSVDAPGSEPG